MVDTPEPEFDESCEFDGPWKRAIETYVEPFFEFFFPVIHQGVDWSQGYEFLDKELEKLAPEATTGRGTVDKLVRVFQYGGEEAWVLIHIEVQNQPETAFARRMYVYNHRLEDRYGRMPISVAVLGDERVGWFPNLYVRTQWGCEVEFRFPAVKLLEYIGRDDELLANTNPFAAVTLAHLKTLATRGDPERRYEWKWTLVRQLYDRDMSREKIVQLLLLIDWIMKLPEPRRVEFESRVVAFEQERTVERLSPFEERLIAKTMVIGREEGKKLAVEESLERSRKSLRSVIALRYGSDKVQTLNDSITAIHDLDLLADLIPIAVELGSVQEFQTRMAELSSTQS